MLSPGVVKAVLLSTCNKTGQWSDLLAQHSCGLRRIALPMVFNPCGCSI